MATKTPRAADKSIPENTKAPDAATKSIRKAPKKRRAPRKKPTGNLVIDKSGDRVLTLELVEEAAAILNDKQLLAFFNCTHEEWEEACRSNPDLLHAPERGRARTVKRIGAKLLAKADEGNLDAIKFYLKSRGGYREDGENVHIGSLGAITAMTIQTADVMEAAKIYQSIMKGE